MKEDFFLKVGYSPYLQRVENRKEKWTSKFAKKIVENKWVILLLGIIFMCIMTNLFLIYRFVAVLEKLQKF